MTINEVCKVSVAFCFCCSASRTVSLIGESRRNIFSCQLSIKDQKRYQEWNFSVNPAKEPLALATKTLLKHAKRAEEFRMSYVQFGWENYSFDICSSMFQHRPETNEDHKQQKWPVTYWYFGGERTQIETFWFPERDVYVG